MSPLSPSSFLRRTFAPVGITLALAAALLISACGGGGVVPATGVAKRALPAEFSTRKAVAYSPYRTATSEAALKDEVIPDANIKQDLDLLVAGRFGLIRLFDSSDKVAAATLRLIKANSVDIKVQLGLYIQSGNDGFNQAEIARAVALANKYPDIVLAVSVGNENMVNWSFNPVSPQVMAGYIAQVRSKISQPVTTDDNFAFWADAPQVITDQIDYASLHTYPELDTIYNASVWDWKQLAVPAASRASAMMDAAIAAARSDYNAARTYLDGRGLSNIPIVIGETGWNAVNQGDLSFRAHPVNQKMYYDRLSLWAAEGRTGAGPKAVFYFEAFDEPWKLRDDKWGLFNVNRQARYVVQSLNPASASWVFEPGVYTAADAVYFTPAVINAAITQNRYTLYSDAPATASEFRPAGLRWDAFDGSTAAYAEVVGAAAPGDGSASIEITPQPASYGWGLLLHPTNGSTDNLSGFAAAGTLKFSIKTSYPGKIQIGISSDTQDRAGAEAYLQLANGQYGLCTTNTWCQVSIPISAFIAANPKLDPSLLMSRFIIADVFAVTGNTQTTGLPKISIDAIYWSR